MKPAQPFPEQLSLLGASDTRRKVRLALDDTSWVEHIPAWISDDRALFEALAQRPEWEQRRRWMYTKDVIEPRLTAEFPSLDHAPVPRVGEIGARLSAAYDVRFVRAWLNLYRDRNDSTAWHSDRPPRPGPRTIPVLSLGATRRFLIRRRAGGPSTTLIVQSGDLVVMGGYCQHDWVHCVPKQREPAGPRISINFASAAPDEGPQSELGA